MFHKLLRDRYGKVLRVIELERQGVPLSSNAVCAGQLRGVHHRRDHYGFRMAPEHILAEHEVAQRERQARRLFDRDATDNMAGSAGIVVRLGGRRIRGRGRGRGLRGGLADPILWELAGHATYLDLQSTGHLPLLADDRSMIIQSHVMEQHLQENIRDADEIVILLRLVERILRFPRYLVLRQQCKRSSVHVEMT